MGVIPPGERNNEFWDGEAVTLWYIRLGDATVMRASMEAQQHFMEKRPCLISRSSCAGMRRYVLTGAAITAGRTLTATRGGLGNLGASAVSGDKPDPRWFGALGKNGVMDDRFPYRKPEEPWMYRIRDPRLSCAIACCCCLCPDIGGHTPMMGNAASDPLRARRSNFWRGM